VNATPVRHHGRSGTGCGGTDAAARMQLHKERGRQERDMKTVMGWIDKIVSKLARRKVDRDEGRR
jgi:hypothetical protein